MNLCLKRGRDANEPAQHENRGFQNMKEQLGGLFLEWGMNGLRSMGMTSLRQIRKRAKVFEDYSSWNP